MSGATRPAWTGSTWAWGLAAAAAAPAAAWLANRWLGLGLPWRDASAALLVVALMPLLEEWVFRALLQQGLAERLATRWASRPALAPHLPNLLASLAFVAMHVPGRGLQALWWLLPSLVLGELWRRGRRLWACALLHGWFNACLLAATVWR